MAHNSDIDRYHAEFEDESAWPRRLLHVISHKWMPGNIYGGVQCPSYAALSYTWGRFALQDAETKPKVRGLDIKGVPWPIPRINPDQHFTMAEFPRVVRETIKTADKHFEFDHLRSERALRKTPVSCIVRPVLRFLERHMQSYQFLWLDVACIEQPDSPTQRAEIGRQARIFQNVTATYVWLSYTPYHRMQSLLDDFATATFGLQRERLERQAAPFDHLQCNFILR